MKINNKFITAIFVFIVGTILISTTLVSASLTVNIPNAMKIAITTFMPAQYRQVYQVIVSPESAILGNLPSEVTELITTANVIANPAAAFSSALKQEALGNLYEQLSYEERRLIGNVQEGMNFAQEVFQFEPDSEEAEEFAKQIEYDEETGITTWKKPIKVDGKTEYEEFMKIPKEYKCEQPELGGYQNVLKLEVEKSSNTEFKFKDQASLYLAKDSKVTINNEEITWAEFKTTKESVFQPTEKYQAITIPANAEVEYDAKEKRLVIDSKEVIGYGETKIQNLADDGSILIYEDQIVGEFEIDGKMKVTSTGGDFYIRHAKGIPYYHKGIYTEVEVYGLKIPINTETSIYLNPHEIDKHFEDGFLTKIPPVLNNNLLIDEENKQILYQSRAYEDSENLMGRIVKVNRNMKIEFLPGNKFFETETEKSINIYSGLGGAKTLLTGKGDKILVDVNIGNTESADYPVVIGTGTHSVIVSEKSINYAGGEGGATIPMEINLVGEMKAVEENGKRLFKANDLKYKVNVDESGQGEVSVFGLSKCGSRTHATGTGKIISSITGFASSDDECRTYAHFNKQDEEASTFWLMNENTAIITINGETVQAEKVIMSDGREIWVSKAEKKTGGITTKTIYERSGENKAREIGFDGPLGVEIEEVEEEVKEVEIPGESSIKMISPFNDEVEKAVNLYEAMEPDSQIRDIMNRVYETEGARLQGWEAHVLKDFKEHYKNLDFSIGCVKDEDCILGKNQCCDKGICVTRAKGLISIILNIFSRVRETKTQPVTCVAGVRG